MSAESAEKRRSPVRTAASKEDPLHDDQITKEASTIRKHVLGSDKLALSESSQSQPQQIGSMEPDEDSKKDSSAAQGSRSRNESSSTSIVRVNDSRPREFTQVRGRSFIGRLGERTGILRTTPHISPTLQSNYRQDEDLDYSLPRQPNFRDNENQRLRNKNAELSTELYATEKRYHDIWALKEREYEAKIAALQRQLSDQHADVESAKSAASMLIEQNRSFAASDKDIMIWFNTRAKAWYEWAKDAAYRDVQRFKSLPKAEAEEMKPLVSDFIALMDGEYPEELLEGKPNKIVYVLLHGMLANFVTSHVFERPFWILDALSRAATAKPTGILTKSTERLYESLLDVDVKKAHQWRACLLQVFSAGMEDTNTGIADDVTDYADVLTGEFLESGAKHLLDFPSEDVEQNHRKLLRYEIEKALEFSLQLWSQRSSLECLDLKFFQTLDKTTFQPEVHRFMEPHQSQEFDSSAAYRGSPILMVVQPAIVAYGTETGERYEEVTRTWLKSRVWLGNKPEPQSK